MGDCGLQAKEKDKLRKRGCGWGRAVTEFLHWRKDDVIDLGVVSSRPEYRLCF